MTTQPLNLPRIRSRLIKVTGNESQSINKILCHIVNDNGHTIFRDAIITDLKIDEARQYIEDPLSEKETMAYAYALADDNPEDLRKDGVKYLLSFGFVTSEEADKYADFIVECERWKMIG